MARSRQQKPRRGTAVGAPTLRPVWRNPDPQASYEAIIIGGGGHGLATAYYLAKAHRLRNSVVIERDWIGDAAWPLPAIYGRAPDTWAAASLYRVASAKFADLANELGFEAGVSRQGVIDLTEDGLGEDAMRHAADLHRLAGGAAQILGHDEILDKIPILSSVASRTDRRFESVLYPDGGIVQPERLAWAYARAAEDLGVDIVQDCEVSEFLVDGRAAIGVETSRGRIEAPVIVIAAEGYASDVAAAAGFGLPIETRTIEAIATEPLAPMLDPAVTARSSDLAICQIETGEIVAWAGAGDYTSFSPWGSGRRLDRLITETARLLPGLGGAEIKRRWSAIVDVAPDGYPLIGRAPLDGVFLNCGWGAAGYAALPASGSLFAELLARFTVNSLIAPFSPSRFESGALLRPAMIPADLSVAGAPCF